jgi:hypothetical protein
MLEKNVFGLSLQDGFSYRVGTKDSHHAPPSLDSNYGFYLTTHLTRSAF